MSQETAWIIIIFFVYFAKTKKNREQETQREGGREREKTRNAALAAIKWTQVIGCPNEKGFREGYLVDGVSHGWYGAAIVCNGISLYDNE